MWIAVSRHQLRLGIGLLLAAGVAVVLIGTGYPLQTSRALALDSPFARRACPLGGVPHGGGCYYYAQARSQYISPGHYARGATASLTVEDPMVYATPTAQGHSLGEFSVSPPGASYDYLEAGWKEGDSYPLQPPQLFFGGWINGVDEAMCDLGISPIKCGGRDFSITSYARHFGYLQPGSVIHLAWQHTHHRWWLLMNGKRLVTFRDSFWHGQFTHVENAEYFGEVEWGGRASGNRCDDMGNGEEPGQPTAARMYGLTFIHGPKVRLYRGAVSSRAGYKLKITGRNRFRFGGPGLC